MQCFLHWTQVAAECIVDMNSSEEFSLLLLLPQLSIGQQLVAAKELASATLTSLNLHCNIKQSPYS